MAQRRTASEVSDPPHVSVAYAEHRREEAMSGKLDGKVSIVTGGSSGIGRGTSLLFGAEGSKVIVADVDVQEGEKTVALIGEFGGDAVFIHTDVSQSAQVRGMVQGTLDHYGKLDLLINVAGRQAETPPLVDVTEEEWDLVMDINIKGTFLACKYAVPHMLEQGGGAIVNVASSAVLRGSSFSLPYSVSKAGVVQLTKTVSSQYASRGIRCNCVIPGLVDTPGSQGVEGAAGIFDEAVARIPVGRAGQPEDIAKLMLYLASDDAAYVTGSAYVIDGGRNVQ